MNATTENRIAIAGFIGGVIWCACVMLLCAGMSV
jgi:hypothetical protein